MRGSYAPSDYDGYYCLKPPFLLWLAILYLARAVLLPLAAGLSSVAAMGPDTRALIQSLVDFNTLIPSAVAVTVLYAAIRRIPSASGHVRWIWSHGRAFLAAAALLDLAVAVMELPIWHGELTDSPPASLLIAALDLYFLTYVLAARRVRDVFADFPLAVDSR